MDENVVVVNLILAIFRPKVQKMQKASSPYTGFRILLLVFAFALVVDVLVLKMCINSPQCSQYFPYDTARFVVATSGRRGVQIIVPKRRTLEAEVSISDATKFGSSRNHTAGNRTEVETNITDVCVGECLVFAYVFPRTSKYGPNVHLLCPLFPSSRRCLMLKLTV